MIRKSSAISSTSITSKSEPIYTVIESDPLLEHMKVGMLVQTKQADFTRLTVGDIYEVFEIKDRSYKGHKVGLRTIDGSKLQDGSMQTYTSPKFLKIVEEL